MRIRKEYVCEKCNNIFYPYEEDIQELDKNESIICEICQDKLDKSIKEKPHPSLEECGFKEKHKQGFII